MSELKVSFVTIRNELVKEVYYALESYIIAWNLEHGNNNPRNWAGWSLDIRCYHTHNDVYRFTVVDELILGNFPTRTVLTANIKVEDSKIVFLDLSKGTDFQKFHHRQANYFRAICDNIDDLQEALAKI